MADTIMGISNQSQGLKPGVCTSTTRPTSPYAGMVIYETDTDRMYAWTGATWSLTWMKTVPSFYAQLTASQTYTASQVVVFNSATVNNGSHYSTSTGRFTAPVSGQYFLQATLLSQPDANGADVRMAINGTTANAYSGFFGGSTNFATYRQIKVGGMFNLNAGDYVTVVAFGTMYIYGDTTYGHTSFTGHWVG